MSEVDQVKPKLVTLGDCDHLDGCGCAFRELQELVEEAEEALCEGIVPGTSSPIRSGEELHQAKRTLGPRIKWLLDLC